MKRERIPFDYWPEQEAMKHTPYKTIRTFRRHYGDLYRAPSVGEKGGYLASDLQARTESFDVQPRTTSGGRRSE